MAERTLSTPPAGTRSNGATNGARPLRRRRALPGGRAVVGGFLVALAAVGIFAGYTGATADTTDPYLVARRDLPLGHRLTRADLGALPMDLPSPLRARAYRDPAKLVGAVLIGPVSKGELVQSSVVLSGRAGTGDREISFEIESARAVNGQLRRGELVDVLATYGTGADGYTVLVVGGARVADRSEAQGTLADDGNEVVTLALPSSTDTMAVAHAVSAGTVTLVRAGGRASVGGAVDASAYRTPPRAAAPAPTGDG